MKKSYSQPTAKLFDIRLEEKIATNCGNYWITNQVDPESCTSLIMNGNADRNTCWHSGTEQGS